MEMLKGKKQKQSALKVDIDVKTARKIYTKRQASQRDEKGAYMAYPSESLCRSMGLDKYPTGERAKA